MKQTIFTLLILMVYSNSRSQDIKTVIANTATSEQAQLKSFDSKLFGCWKGSEIEQQKKGLSKYWVACRFEDGTSTLLFVAIDKNGKVTQETENGKWWVQNGKFHEYHNVSGITDIYQYEVIDNSIRFTALELMGNKNPNYSFFDFKIEED